MDPFLNGVLSGVLALAPVVIVVVSETRRQRRRARAAETVAPVPCGPQSGAGHAALRRAESPGLVASVFGARRPGRRGPAPVRMGARTEDGARRHGPEVRRPLPPYRRPAARGVRSRPRDRALVSRLS